MSVTFRPVFSKFCSKSVCLILSRIPIHDIGTSIGSENSKGLLYFQVIDGCDVISAYLVKGIRVHGKHGMYLKTHTTVEMKLHVTTKLTCFAKSPDNTS